MCGRPKVLKRLIYPSARKEFLVPEAKDGVKGLLPPQAEVFLSCQTCPVTVSVC